MMKPNRGRPSSNDADSHVPEPGYGAFHVTWGESQGADPRRLLAIVCRKGRIHSKDVGAIRIGATSSVIEVRAQVAGAFAKAARVRDRRDPLVKIEPVRA
jgi:ATP-dependent RNA helicase DeaD